MNDTANGTLLIVLGVALAFWGVFIASTGTIPLIGLVPLALGAWAIIAGTVKARQSSGSTDQ